MKDMKKWLMVVVIILFTIGLLQIPVNVKVYPDIPSETISLGRLLFVYFILSVSLFPVFILGILIVIFIIIHVIHKAQKRNNLRKSILENEN